MVLVFSSAIFLIIATVLLHPDLFLKGDLLSKVKSQYSIKLGLGLTTIILGGILIAYFAFHVIIQVRWLVVFFLGMLLILVGTMSAGSVLKEKIKNKQSIDIINAIEDVYGAFTKVFTETYFAYTVVILALLSILFAFITDI